ncbi:uncharacterized protein LOC123615796 [Camelus bactrianus]|uniref:Uncharacterized protein LOC123615796 n=1 Tax=Camelus bactrianus TaxID=9837 RepID=A0AC58RJP1_CAMBA
MKPFIYSISLQASPGQIQQRFRANLVFKSSLFCGALRGSPLPWLSSSTNNAAKSLGTPLARFQPGGTRQKRQVPAAPGPPAHTAPGRGRAGQGRAAPFEERRPGRGGGGPRGRPPGPRRPAAAGGAGAAEPRAEPAAGSPLGSLPQRRQTTHRSAERRRRGSLWPRSGRLLVLSSPGWARPGCGAAEAASGPELGGGSGWSAGDSAAAASAGMCLGRSSLKCGASHSLTPASLPRRAAAAAAGALPFLVAHSLTRPPRSRLPLLRVRAPAPPPLLAGRTHHGCAPGPPPPRALPRRHLSASGCSGPPHLPSLREWLSGDCGWSDGGPGDRGRERGLGRNQETCTAERKI